MFIVVMIASMAAVGLSTTGSSNSPGAPVEDLDPLEETPATNVQSFDKAEPVVDENKAYVATLETNKGTIKIDLLTQAPEAVNSFAFLAGNGFYNGTTFFYVNQDYFAQGGDPTCAVDAEGVCTGTAGPGYTLNVENETASHDQWSVVAPYVTQGQTVHGSQFRILFKADERLDGDETVFGKITDTASQDILKSLGNFEPCSVVAGDTCEESADMSSGLVIEKVIVAPKSA